MELKKLYEKRDAIIEASKKIVELCVAEERAFTEDEKTKVEAFKEELRQLNDTIKMAEEMPVQAPVIRSASEPAKEEDKAVAEERAFEAYIRGTLEQRAGEIDFGTNGAVVPASIANKIISKVVELSPLFAKASRYDIGGTLTIPYYDESASKITMAYAAEFTALTSSSGKFKSVSLTGFLAGALTKVSASLINNSNFNIVNYVVEKMAEAAARWIEGELINGTATKIDGLSKASNIVTTASTTAITADEIITLQDTIPDAYQGNAFFVMSRATRTAIRKLKDGDGNYLLNKDYTSAFGYTLLGKDVYVSEAISDIATGKVAVIYCDPTGLAVKVSENVEVQVLREKFADEHAVGVIAWLEMDSKIENEEKIAVLKIK